MRVCWVSIPLCPELARSLFCALHSLLQSELVASCQSRPLTPFCSFELLFSIHYLFLRKPLQHHRVYINWCINLNPFTLNPFVVTWCTFRTVTSDKSTCQRCSNKWPCSGWVEEIDWDGGREREVLLVPSPLRPILTPINLSSNYIIIIIIIIITNNWWENQTVCFWNYDTLATVFVIEAMKATIWRYLRTICVGWGLL